jgi:hypothetical protein
MNENGRQAILVKGNGMACVRDGLKSRVARKSVKCPSLAKRIDRDRMRGTILDDVGTQ